MEDEIPRTRSIVRLLGTLVALVALQVIGFGVAAFLLVREFSQARAALQGGAGDQLAALQESLKRSVDLAEELTRRQEALAAGMGSRAAESMKRIDELQRRRAELQELAKGLGKMDQMVRLNQLMADEMLLLLEHVAITQDSLARAVRPLPTQREVLQPGRDQQPERGVGGGGQDRNEGR